MNWSSLFLGYSKILKHWIIPEKCFACSVIHFPFLEWENIQTMWITKCTLLVWYWYCYYFVFFSWIYLTHASEHAIIIKLWNNNTNVIHFSIVCFNLIVPKMNEYECKLNTNKAPCTETVACRPFPLNWFYLFYVLICFLSNGWFKTISCNN